MGFAPALLALALGARGLATEVRYADVAPIIREKCAICHRGPFLDLTRFPFQWSESDDQGEIVDELIRRMNLTGWGRMPPPNGPPLSCDEILLVEAWRQSGLKGESPEEGGN